MARTTPAEVLDRISRRDIPAVVLVGGDSEYLVSDSWRAIRDAIVEAESGVAVETFPENADLGVVLDSFRTFSLFAGKRLLLVPELNAFVTRKEVAALYEKASADWTSAKTDRKRATAVAKFLHLLGLLGFDTDATEEQIADALGMRRVDAALGGLLSTARISGKRATRGEGDAALLTEAIARGGAPGTTLLMKSGELPENSATVEVIARGGVVIERNLSREEFVRALDEAVREIATDAQVKFDAPAVALLRQRLGIDHILADKFSRDVPDIRSAIGEAERLASLAGAGGRVTTQLVQQNVASVATGARWELGSLFAERKLPEAVEKLRELVAQARREEPSTPLDVQVGKFLFPIADEIRQLLGIISFCRLHSIDLKRPMQFNAFKGSVAEPMSEYLKQNRIVRQKPNPFPLYKRYESARLHKESELLAMLSRLADIDFARKSGGVPPDVSLETLLLSRR